MTLLTDIVAKRFFMPERRTVFSHLDRIGNFDSQNRPFGFYYCRISLARPLLRDFCNNIDPELTNRPGVCRAGMSANRPLLPLWAVAVAGAQYAKSAQGRNHATELAAAARSGARRWDPTVASAPISRARGGLSDPTARDAPPSEPQNGSPGGYR